MRIRAFLHRSGLSEVSWVAEPLASGKDEVTCSPSSALLKEDNPEDADKQSGKPPVHDITWKAFIDRTLSVTRIQSASVTRKATEGAINDLRGQC